MDYIYDKLLNVVAKQQKISLKQFSKNEKNMLTDENACDNI